MPAIIELCRPSRGVVCHLRRLFQRPAVLEIGGDAGRPKAVVAELGIDAGRGGAPADHRIGVARRQHGAGELAGAAADGAEQRPLGVVADAGLVEIGGEVGLKVVVAGHGMRLAAFLPQPHPKAAVLREHVLDLHAERSADAREAVDHEGNQRPVAQSRRRRDVDGIEQRPRLGRLQHRRLAGACGMRRAAHRSRGIDGHHLARHQPVEQVADRGQAQLDGRRRKFARLPLDPGRHMQRLHRRDRRHAMLVAPGQEVGHSAAVGPPRVRVADGGREEFQEAPRGLVAGHGDQRRQGWG